MTALNSDRSTEKRLMDEEFSPGFHYSKYMDNQNLYEMMSNGTIYLKEYVHNLKEKITHRKMKMLTVGIFCVVR